MTGNGIDDAVLRQLVAGRRLSTLLIDNTAVSDGAVADAILRNPGLGVVAISNCPISLSTVQGMKRLKQLHSLTVSHIAAERAEVTRLRAELLEDLPFARITLTPAYE